MPAKVDRSRPRLATRVPRTCSDVVDDVDQVAQLYLGFSLDPWQREWLRRLTAYSPETGLWLHARAGLLVARQNGKTAAMQAFILWAVLNGFRVLGTAQNLEEGNDSWDGIVRGLFDGEDAPLLCMVKRIAFAAGARRLELVNGGAYYVRASNDKSARGLRAVDIVWIDEARLVGEDALGAMVPTQTKSPNKLTVVTSNAGDVTSHLLRRWRDQAVKAIDSKRTGRLAWAEWSGDPGLSIDDPASWQQANPAPWVTAQSVADDREAMTEAKFVTERLCRWVTGSLESAIGRAKWENLTGQLPPQPDRGTLVLAVGQDPHGRAAVIVAADQDPDTGKVRVSLVEGWRAEGATVVTDRDVAEGVVRAYERLRPGRIILNTYTSGSVSAQLTRVRLPIEDLKGVKFFTSCQHLLDLVNTRDIVHDGSALLTDHLANAVRQDAKTEGFWYFSRVRSPGPIAGAEAVAMAAYVARTTRPRLKPVTATG